MSCVLIQHVANTISHVYSLYPFTLYPHHTSVHVTFDSIHDTAACSFGDCLGDQAAQICIHNTPQVCCVLRSADPRAQVSGVALLLLRLGIKGFFLILFLISFIFASLSYVGLSLEVGTHCVSSPSHSVVASPSLQCVCVRVQCSVDLHICVCKGCFAPSHDYFLILTFLSSVCHAAMLLPSFLSFPFFLFHTQRSVVSAFNYVVVMFL